MENWQLWPTLVGVALGVRVGEGVRVGVRVGNGVRVGAAVRVGAGVRLGPGVVGQSILAPPAASGTAAWLPGVKATLPPSNAAAPIAPATIRRSNRQVAPYIRVIPFLVLMNLFSRVEIFCELGSLSVRSSGPVIRASHYLIGCRAKGIEKIRGKLETA
jgi:hypothetical protein